MNRDYDRISPLPENANEENDFFVKIKAFDLTANEVKEHQDIPGGDMPGDRMDVKIGSIIQARNLFPVLSEKIGEAASKNPYGRAVVSIAGGSGSGKTVLASLMSYYLNLAGIKSYTLSGDNFVHRIPEENDAGRRRVFRHNGVRSVVDSGLGSKEVFEEIMAMQKEEDETGRFSKTDSAWWNAYLEGGRKALKRHLGTPHEQNFSEMNDVLNAFRDGAKDIWLRRMGRDDTAFWYEKRDFSDTAVIFLEWTHGLSEYLTGIDISVFLNSTPEETYAFRQARARDANAKSDLIQLVIDLEQQLLLSEAPTADLIVNRQGEAVSFEDWKKIMGL